MWQIMTEHYSDKDPIPLTMNFGIPPAAQLAAGSGFDYVVLPKGCDELGVGGAIHHREVGTPRSHRRFLGRMGGSYGPIPALRLPGLLPMPFNRTGLQGLYCVGDSCFPGQGLNAVAFSGFACAHRIGADLGLNPWALPA